MVSVSCSGCDTIKAASRVLFVLDCQTASIVERLSQLVLAERRNGVRVDVWLPLGRFHHGWLLSG